MESSLTDSRLSVDIQCKLFLIGFLDENIFALKGDNNNKYIFFINETKYDSSGINIVSGINEFLRKKYLGKKKQLPHTNYI